MIRLQAKTSRMQWLMTVTTLVATVSNDFVRRLLDVHAPRDTNAKNCIRDRQLRVVWMIRNCWTEALLLTWSESLGVTVTAESKQLWKNRESHSEVCIFRVLSQQWPSIQITLFWRTRQSVWLDALTTPVDKTQMNCCVLKMVCPLNQATNGYLKNYQKWSRFNGNYQNRRTHVVWLMVLSTKIDAACI